MSIAIKKFNGTLVDRFNCYIRGKHWWFLFPAKGLGICNHCGKKVRTSL